MQGTGEKAIGMERVYTSSPTAAATMVIGGRTNDGVGVTSHGRTGPITTVNGRTTAAVAEDFWS